MSVIALSSCAAAPFAQRPTSAANRYVLIVYCCASLALMQARLLSLWQELARSIDALARFEPVGVRHRAVRDRSQRREAARDA